MRLFPLFFICLYYLLRSRGLLVGISLRLLSPYLVKLWQIRNGAQGKQCHWCRSVVTTCGHRYYSRAHFKKVVLQGTLSSYLVVWRIFLVVKMKSLGFLKWYALRISNTKMYRFSFVGENRNVRLCRPSQSAWGLSLLMVTSLMESVELGWCLTLFMINHVG